MKEFEGWINEVRQTNMDTKIPIEIVNSLNKIIQESAPLVAVEIMQQQSTSYLEEFSPINRLPIYFGEW